MDTRPLPLLLPETGSHHLDSLAEEIHRTYFFRHSPLRVRWGQQITRKRRHSIRLGSYNHATTEIRIHPLLNAPNIPAFFIQSVIHHEYLHHVLGPDHNRRFHAHERQFRYYRESKEWLRHHVFGLLGRRAKRLRRERDVPPQLALF